MSSAAASTAVSLAPLGAASSISSLLQASASFSGVAATVAAVGGLASMTFDDGDDGDDNDEPKAVSAPSHVAVAAAVATASAPAPAPASPAPALVPSSSVTNAALNLTAGFSQQLLHRKGAEVPAPPPEPVAPPEPARRDADAEGDVASSSSSAVAPPPAPFAALATTTFSRPLVVSSAPPASSPLRARGAAVPAPAAHEPPAPPTQQSAPRKPFVSPIQRGGAGSRGGSGGGSFGAPRAVAPAPSASPLHKSSSGTHVRSRSVEHFGGPSRLLEPTVASAAARVPRVEPLLPASRYLRGENGGHTRDWVDVRDTSLVQRLPEVAAAPVPDQVAALALALASANGGAKEGVIGKARSRSNSVTSVGSNGVARPRSASSSAHPLRRSSRAAEIEDALYASHARAAGLVVGSRVSSRVAGSGGSVEAVVSEATARLFARAADLRARRQATVAAVQHAQNAQNFMPRITAMARRYNAVPYVNAEELAEAVGVGAGGVVAGADDADGGAPAAPVVTASRFDALYASAAAGARRRADLERAVYGPKSGAYPFAPAITRRAASLTPSTRLSYLARTNTHSLQGPLDTSAAVRVATQGGSRAPASPASPARRISDADGGGGGPNNTASATDRGADDSPARTLGSRLHAYSLVYQEKRAQLSRELQAQQVPGVPKLNKPRAASAAAGARTRERATPLYAPSPSTTREALASQKAARDVAQCTFSPAINRARGASESRPASRLSLSSAGRGEGGVTIAYPRGSPVTVSAMRAGDDRGSVRSATASRETFDRLYQAAAETRAKLEAVCPPPPARPDCAHALDLTPPFSLFFLYRTRLVSMQRRTNSTARRSDLNSSRVNH